MLEAVILIATLALATPLVIGALYVVFWPRVESQIEADDNI